MSSPGLLLPNALARRDLTVLVLDGFGTRGIGALNPVGSIAHWTAGPKFNGNKTATPSLAIVTNGKSRGLDNALCNTYGRRDGAVVVVAALTAWHGGVGSYRGISGNNRYFGHEMEYAGAGDMTPEQRWSYPRIIAAYHDIIGRDPAEWAIAHDEYAPERKIDIGPEMRAIRAEASAIWKTPAGTPAIDWAALAAIEAAKNTPHWKGEHKMIWIPEGNAPGRYPVFICGAYVIGLGMDLLTKHQAAGVPAITVDLATYDELIKQANLLIKPQGVA